LLGCQAAHNKDPSIGGWHLALGNFNQICSCSCNISTTTTTTTTLNVCSWPLTPTRNTYIRVFQEVGKQI